ncbi:MAG: NADH-quinone oxidoreductase subunit A [Deltaproteobacteria bacterium]|nr:NADH-quinone oxidoreductase subunit A [Candidatus Anaeroferrophillus wilburensis]MBN2889977.1 NADH-quinone oxidoreductase subunit A [Deltaproteobacteria bacterium]
MSEKYLVDFTYVFLFLLVGFIVAFSIFVISNVLRPRLTNKKTLQAYECGMDPYGSAWDIRFGVSYYLYALIFLAFDVDILYLFPVATAFDRVDSLRGVIEFVVFISILSLAVIYAWAKGVFVWPKKKEMF